MEPHLFKTKRRMGADSVHKISMSLSKLLMLGARGIVTGPTTTRRDRTSSCCPELSAKRTNQIVSTFLT